MRSIRIYLFIILTGLFASSVAAVAQTITPATGGSAISADDFGTGTWTTITGPVIQETSPGQLTPGNFRLRIPAGFIFDSGGTDPTITVTSPKSQKITVTLSSRTSTELVFAIAGSSSGTPPNNPHRIEFGDIRVRPDQGTPLASGNITNVGSAAPGGTTSYGTLTMVAGADNQIRVETGPTSAASLVSAQNIEAGTSITVYSNVRDQYGNFKRNESAAWSTENETGGVVDADLSVASGANTTFTADQTGTATIRASFGGLTPVESGTLTVTPSSPATLFIATQPSANAVAGTDFSTQPVIHILDAFGNIVTSDNFTVITATRNSGTGTLQGDVDITATGGIATFTDLSHRVANTIDIDFSSSGFTTVNSNSILVNHAPGDSLLFVTQPSNGNRNDPVPTIEVQVIDPFGNAVDTTGVNIILSLNSGSGSITAGDTESTDGTGLATFNSVVFNQTGLKTIIASASGLSNSGISDSFTIAQAGSLAGFEIFLSGGGSIGTQTAGTPFNIEIRAVDGIGDLLDGSMGRDNFEGSIDLTTNSIFSGSTTVDSIGPFVNGVFASHSVELIRSGNNIFLTATNSGSTESGSSNTFTVEPSTADTDSSFLSVSADTLIADGISESLVTLQLRDEFGNNLNTDVTETIAINIASGTGTLGGTTGNGDGTYEATLTAPSAVGSATLEATIDAVAVTSGNPEVVYTYDVLDNFLIEAVGGGSIGSQTAGVSFDVRITAFDAFNNVVESFNGTGNTVEITSTGTLSAGSGTTTTFTNGILTSHTVTLTSAGNQTLTARKTASSETGTSNTFTVNPAAADANTTTITAAQNFLQNDGTDNTTISIQLKDQFGNNLITNPGTVNVFDDGNAAVTSPATYVSNGLYTTTLTSSTTAETVTVTADLNGSTVFTDQAVVVITQFNVWQGDASGNPSNKTDWGNTQNWSLGSLPATGQVVVVPTGLTYYPIIDGEDPVLDFLNVESGGNVTMTGRTITFNNEVTGGGSFFANSSTVNIGGDISIANFIAGSSDVYFNGTSTQTIADDFTGNNIFIQNDLNATSQTFLEAFSSLQITSGITLSMGTGTQLVAIGDIIIDGNLTGNNSTFSFGGDINVGGSAVITLTGTDLVLNGTTEQEINGVNNIKSFTVDNPAGIVINNDIVISDTLFINDGTVTIESGFSFVTNVTQGNTADIIARRIIDGNVGWRMISPPLQSTYNDFLDSTITQGYTGSQLGNAPGDSLQPNVLYYDETGSGTDNQRWRAPASASTSLTPGRGLFVFFFDDQTPADPRYDNPLPDTLDIQGAENNGDGTNFTFPVTYTAAGDTGWNMVGNPFTATLDWDDGNWTKTNMDNVIYVWSDTANAGNGDYLTWNGLTGSLGDGLIAPFQGFWVRANGNGSPVLRVNKASKTTGGTFYKQADRGTPTFELSLSVAGLKKSIHFSFTDEGSFNKDELDAYRLQTFQNETYLEFFSILDNGSQLVINNLPRDFGIPIDIPVYANGYIDGLSPEDLYTVNWKGISDIPDSWVVQLLDSRKNVIANLKEEGNFKFLPKTKRKQAIRPSAFSEVSSFELTRRDISLIDDSDLYIRIIPGDDGSQFPKEFALQQNYPNPFNPETTIQFDLPIQSPVELTIFDVLGRKVRTLVNEELNAGSHTINWDARDMASGVYLYRLVTSNGTLIKKMTLLK